MSRRPLLRISHGEWRYAVGFQGFADIHKLVPGFRLLKIVLFKYLCVVQHKVHAGADRQAVLLPIHLAGSQDSLVESVLKRCVFLQIRGQVRDGSAVCKPLYPFAVPGKEQIRHIASSEHDANLFLVSFVGDHLRLDDHIGVLRHVGFGQSVPVGKPVFFRPLVHKPDFDLSAAGRPRIRRLSRLSCSRSPRVRSGCSTAPRQNASRQYCRRQR